MNSQERLVDLVRHGEVEGGTRYGGTSDDPLSARGWRQMQQVADQCPEWDCIFTSPARRCAAYAESLATERNLGVRILPELGERAFGDWEGKRPADIPIDLLVKMWDDPVGYTPPGAEKFVDFSRRVVAGWNAVIGHESSHPLVLCHGGVVRVLLGELFGVPAKRLLSIEVPPACLTRIRLTSLGGPPSLVTHVPPPDVVA